MSSVAPASGRMMPIAAILFCAAIGGGCGRPPEPTAAEPPAVEPLPADIEQQVHAFCGACHAYPPADSFPRQHWRVEVERGFRFFDQAGLALAPPKLSHVVRYYEERAPIDFPPATIVPATHELPVRFETVSYPPPGTEQPVISNVNPVKLYPPGAKPEARAREPITLLACDMAGGSILALRPADPSPQWRELGKATHPARADVVDLNGDGILDILVADLGSFAPTDRRCGSVVWLRGKPDGTFQTITLLKDVGRVSDVRAADFRGAGKLDLIVGSFGLHAVGEILFLENRTTEWDKPEFAPSVIDDRHGAIHVPVADLNGDGRPDFVALIAQEFEEVVAFLSDGGGKFAKKTLYRAPHPAWGSSGIQLVDMNGDGRLDLLYTNGDILDEPYLWKPYHGLQWLENKGDLKFESHRIANMYGIHNAVAAPICGGKLPDILAVSFLPADKFPDRAAKKADAVVIFEQVAPGRFERHVLATGSCDAVVCAAADLYGTGRFDLAIGNFGAKANNHPVAIWKNRGKR
ncbi:MAG TPA: VCBS repeat-containing protein [Gemmataceae bacterium]|jgi:hypothetical protein